MKKEETKNKKSKKWAVILIITILVLGIAGSIGGYLVYQNHKAEQERIAKEKKEKEEAQLLKAIKDSYNNQVKITDDTKLYKLDKKKYVEGGQVSKDTYIILEEKKDITINDKYFKIKNIDYYVYYKDVTPTDKREIDDNYKNYVPFDNNIITKIPTNFYKDDKLVYSIDESIQASIIINDSNYYYVEYDNQLLGIRKDNVEKTVEVKRNTAIATNIGVLNYHFFHNKSKGEVCNEIICLDTAKFEEQLKYLKDNGFYTATMEDMSLWMERKIRLPKKTAVITIDDGAMGTDTHLIELLEKYDLHGTLFLITAWWPKEKYASNNLEIQSHGNNIHNFTNEALYKTKSELLDDFKLSIDALDGEKTAFCYPYYAHNATVRSAVKESGFKIAFVGGNTKASQNNDPYQIRRYVIYSYTTLNQFINMVN